MRISDWSSDVCSSDLVECCDDVVLGRAQQDLLKHGIGNGVLDYYVLAGVRVLELHPGPAIQQLGAKLVAGHFIAPLLEGTLGELHDVALVRSEEHTSELQSLMRISYAVFCLKKKNNNNINIQ